jgi:hypothetical protein
MKRFGVMRMLIVAAAFGCGFGSFESAQDSFGLSDSKRRSQGRPAGNAGKRCWCRASADAAGRRRRRRCRCGGCRHGMRPGAREWTIRVPLMHFKC